MNIETEQEQNIMRKDAIITYLNNIIKDISVISKDELLSGKERARRIDKLVKNADSIANDESYYYDYPTSEINDMLDYFGYNTTIEQQENKKII